MITVRILAICGSPRRDSYNHKLLVIAKQMASNEAGAQVDEIKPSELALPFYNQAIEDAGLPESVPQLKAAVENADVLLIASPEYNHSISGVLKNAIDWLSRGTNSLDKKVAAIFGASNGPYGTLRGQFHLRQILSALNVFILPQPQIMVRFAEKAFNPDGSLVDQKTHELLKKLVVGTLALAQKLKQ